MGKKTFQRVAAWSLTLLLVLALVPTRGKAVLDGVYFTAANEQLLDLTSETMPFYSGGVLYVSSKVFEGTDLGVTFVYNSTTKMAMLYTARTDLRFDLANQTTYDKNGNKYQAYAMERNGYVFLPIGTVCGFFGLVWTINETDTAPLIRVRSSSAILSDRDFIDAASNDMQRRYAAYEKQVEESGGNESPQVYPEYTGQKIHLLVACQTREDTLAVLKELGNTAQGTFLLTAEQMEDGDLLRALIAGGHAVALAASGETEEDVEAQIIQGRNLLWQDNYSASSANSATSVYSTRYLQPGETVPEGWKSMPDPLDPSKTLIFEDNDWQRQMYKPSLYQNYYVSLSGGTSRTRYMASLGYTDDNGVAIGTGYSRFAGRINLQSDITDKLKFRANVDYSDTNNDYMPNQMNQISRGLSQAPTMRLYFDDGTPAYGYNATSQSPLYYEWHTQRTSRYKRLSLVGGLSYQIFKDLKADLQMSLYNQDRRWGAFQKANYFSGSRPASENYSETTNKKIEFYLDYSKTIKDHTIAAMAGYSYYHVNQNGFGAAAEGASSDKIPTLTASPVKTDATSSLSEEVLIGYFARINYDYKKKYLLTATFRADGSSKFAPGHQWGYFPGVSVGWIMSEENFMKNVKPISYWKWRVSYGQTGNNAIGLWDARGQYATNKYDGNAGIYPSVMPNENLTWEVTDQLDAGIELALFDNRVMFTGDYFNKVTKNLLFSKNMPNTSGFSDVQTNIGKVRFWGFDIDITTRNIVRKNFTWETKFTWSYVRNKVLELPDNGRDRNRIGGITLADGTAFGGTAEGEPLYRYYGYKISHILQTPEEAANALYDNSSVGYDPLTGKSQKGQKFAGDYEWMNRPGSEKIVIDGEEREMISNQDQFLLGYTVPHSTGGLGNTIVFRNWTFNLYLDWALGHSILNDTEARYFINTFTSNTAISSKVKDCWTHVGDTDAKYAKFSLGKQPLLLHCRGRRLS